MKTPSLEQETNLSPALEKETWSTSSVWPRGPSSTSAAGVSTGFIPWKTSKYYLSTPPGFGPPSSRTAPSSWCWWCPAARRGPCNMRPVSALYRDHGSVADLPSCPAGTLKSRASTRRHRGSSLLTVCHRLQVWGRAENQLCGTGHASIVLSDTWPVLRMSLAGSWTRM